LSNRPAIRALILDPTGGVPSTISLNKIRVPNGTAPTDCWQFRRNLETAEYTRCLERHIRSRYPARLKDTYREKSLLYTDFRALRADFHLSSPFDLARGRRADDVYGWRQAALPMAPPVTDKLFVRLQSRKSYAEDKSTGKQGAGTAAIAGGLLDGYRPGSATRHHAVCRTRHSWRASKTPPAHPADDIQRSGIKSTAKKAMQYQQDM